MKVDMQHFQPLAMHHQRANGMLKTDNDAKKEGSNHINKNDVATNLVNNKLNDALGVATPVESSNSGLFDAEGVAKNILGFVSNAINDAKENGATPEKLEKMLTDAQKGMRKGLSEASKALSESGLLTDEISIGIKKVGDLLSEGVQTLSDNLFKTDKAALTGLSSYREASHYSLTKEGDYRITTKEGDEINITFNADYLQQSASAVRLSDQSFEYAASQQSSFQAAFSIEINGELNDDEQQAVNALMGSLQNVSELFFSGDFDAAFERAQAVSMDSSQLASFSMDLQRTETVASIKEYQQIMPGKALANQFIPLNTELTNAFEQAKPFAIEAHLTELLDWLIPEEHEADDLLAYSQAVFGKLAELSALEEL